jgi:SAM-dependent methyltransferase
MRRFAKTLARRIRNKIWGPKELNRPAIAKAYLQGQGIEIGALHRPLEVPPAAHVRYVDRFPNAGLKEHYPELKKERLVPVEIVDDGEKLATIADASQDFVIANHFFEHCQDPIASFQNFMRVLKTGGVLFMAVPDKRYTFDLRRPVTPLAHMVRDHDEGPGWSRVGHFHEWVRLVHGASDDKEVSRQVTDLLTRDYSIHYHVWTQKEFLELLLELRKRVEFEVELFLKRHYEIVVVLRKGADSGSAAALAAA